MNIYIEEVVKAIRNADTEEEAAKIFLLATELLSHCDTGDWVTMSFKEWLSTGDMDGGWIIVSDCSVDVGIETFLKLRITEALRQPTILTGIREGVLFVLQDHLQFWEKENRCDCYIPSRAVEECEDCVAFVSRLVPETRAAIDAAKTMKLEVEYRAILSPQDGWVTLHRAAQIQVGTREPVWAQARDPQENDVVLDQVDIYKKLKSLVQAT